MVRYALLAVAALLLVIGVRAPAHAADAAQMEANKKTVAALYDAALNKKDFEEAKKYLGNRYTQHNPTAKDGPEGLKEFTYAHAITKQRMKPLLALTTFERTEKSEQTLGKMMKMLHGRGGKK